MLDVFTALPLHARGLLLNAGTFTLPSTVL